MLMMLALTAVQAVPEKAPRREVILNYGGGGWKDNQIHEPCVLVNPKDPSRLVMFYGGAVTEAKGSHGSLGKAWARVSDPFKWHEDPANPILTGDPKIAFEAHTIRVDTVVYREELDEYWIYYTGRGNSGADAIGLATCPAGKDGYSDILPANIRRFAGNPILAPQGQGRDDETHVSQGAVIREGELWYSLYSYRTSKSTLPGLRLATSGDGKAWTKAPGPDLLTAAPESLYIEWHQVSKIDGRYVLLYEAYNGGQRWVADVATSAELTRGWKKAPVSLIDQTRWPAYADDTMYHVATPALYRVGGKWHLYFQAAPKGPYLVQRWTMGCLEADAVVAGLPR
jgi:hypothetical protein